MLIQELLHHLRASSTAIASSKGIKAGARFLASTVSSGLNLPKPLPNDSMPVRQTPKQDSGLLLMNSKLPQYGCILKKFSFFGK